MDGAPLVVDTRKAVAILALLGAEGRAFARDELAALLWPDSDASAANGALRRTLSSLRAAAGPESVLVDRSRVALDPARVRVDLADLERLAGSDSRRSLAAAAALARGPFLAGFNLRDSPEFDDWRAARAVAVERTVMTVLDKLAAANLAAGDLPGAIAAASHRLDLDSLDEAGHVRLMDLYARSGDRAAALRQYRLCRRDPGPRARGGAARVHQPAVRGDPGRGRAGRSAQMRPPRGWVQAGQRAPREPVLSRRPRSSSVGTMRWTSCSRPTRRTRPGRAGSPPSSARPASARPGSPRPSSSASAPEAARSSPPARTSASGPSPTARSWSCCDPPSRTRAPWSVSVTRASVRNWPACCRPSRQAVDRARPVPTARALTLGSWPPSPTA